MSLDPSGSIFCPKVANDHGVLRKAGTGGDPHAISQSRTLFRRSDLRTMKLKVIKGNRGKNNLINIQTLHILLAIIQTGD